MESRNRHGLYRRLLTITVVSSLAFLLSGCWTIVASPSPPDGSGSSLLGVSCNSATNCFAVGNSDRTTLVEHWDGAAWSIVPSPNPNGVESTLYGVSCTSNTDCVAVGLSKPYAPPAESTLIERWDGTSWTIVPSPDVTGASQNVLSSVSCTSGTSCFAVGFYASGSKIGISLIERWNGTTWAISASPNPAGSTDTLLEGVSCFSATSCFATGYAAKTNTGPGFALTEHWDGKSWAIATPPRPADAIASHLQGVSCVTATACFAVGSYADGSGIQHALAETWDGTTWTVTPSADPPGSVEAVLGSVSCVSVTSCSAVGRYTDSPSSYKTLAQRWDGTQWTITSTVNPQGATSSLLYSVSCTSAKGCFAIGRYDDSDRRPLTLTERES
ncbi:MAG: hypothetical protein JWL83_2399 [Actinomycetia bacterium]|nr:hypothetical protein [Actinomycetes bacterium]